MPEFSDLEAEFYAKEGRYEIMDPDKFYGETDEWDIRTYRKNALGWRNIKKWRVKPCYEELYACIERMRASVDCI